MKFELEKSIEVLERTPEVLQVLLKDLSDGWIQNNEGANTWSPYDIMGHLIHGEKTDWMIRIRTILGAADNKLFLPFDRFAQLRENQNKSIDELVFEFEQLRDKNIGELKGLRITKKQLQLTGTHPELGEVTLRQLISTWVVHDLGHISQISRVMAKQYQDEVGPWINYLGILK